MSEPAGAAGSPIAAEVIPQLAAAAQIGAVEGASRGGRTVAEMTAADLAALRACQVPSRRSRV